LSALSGAERIFDMMDEAEEIDEGKVTLCNICKNADGTLNNDIPFSTVFSDT